MISPIKGSAAILAAKHDSQSHIPHVIREGLFSFSLQVFLRHARCDDKLPASAKQFHERTSHGMAGRKAKCVHTLDQCPCVHFPKSHVAEGREDAQRRAPILEPFPPTLRSLPPRLPLGDRWGRAPRPPLEFSRDLLRDEDGRRLCGLGVAGLPRGVGVL